MHTTKGTARWGGWGGPDNGLNGKATVPFSGFRCKKDKKGKGFHQLKYMKR